MALFHNRQEAAHELARHLLFLKTENPIVLGIVNGGVPMAEIIAQALDAPLDVLLIQHLAAPKNPDHIVGAVDENGRISAIKSTARWHHITSQQLIAPARDAFRELQRRAGRIRSVLPALEVRDRTVIVVSQGIATGAKMLGAIASLRDRGVRKIIATAPAGAGEAAWHLHDAADLVIIPHRPAKFKGVEKLYSEYVPATDELVYAIVERWVKSRPLPAARGKTLSLKLANDLNQLISCELDLPPGAGRGSGPYPTVFFAHNYESDSRNRRTVPIAERLAEIGIISARLDFTGHGRSQGELSTATQQRMYNDLKVAVAQLRELDEVDEDRLGLVGSGTGALLALNLATELPGVQAVVVRGPLAGKEPLAARHVSPPTMLIYTEDETVFCEAAEQHRAEMPSTHSLLLVPDANRLFNDEISLRMMVGATVDWLDDHLTPLPTVAETVDPSAFDSNDIPLTDPAAPENV